MSSIDDTKTLHDSQVRERELVFGPARSGSRHRHREMDEVRRYKSNTFGRSLSRRLSSVVEAERKRRRQVNELRHATLIRRSDHDVAELGLDRAVSITKIAVVCHSAISEITKLKHTCNVTEGKGVDLHSA